jgi:hypothetical protein
MTVSRYLDRIAISLSAICIVHCLAVPLIVAILPIAAISFGGDAHFHALILWLVVPVSLIGLVMGFRVHGRVSLVALGVAGVVILALAATVGHEQWPALAEVLVSVGGSLLLASAHWMNFVVVRKMHVHHHC